MATITFSKNCGICSNAGRLTAYCKADGHVPIKNSPVKAETTKALAKKCDVCRKNNHTTDKCLYTCSRCNVRASHLTHECQVDLLQIQCRFCKEYGHHIASCFAAQKNKGKIADSTKRRGLCQTCGLYGHKTEQHDLVIMPCEKCDSTYHQPKQCKRCFECREYCNEDKHPLDTYKEVTFTYKDFHEFIKTKTVSAVNSHCPTEAPYCQKCNLAHTWNRCPQTVCSFCGEVGHIPGPKCEQNSHNARYQ